MAPDPIYPIGVPPAITRFGASLECEQDAEIYLFRNTSCLWTTVR
jgi:hypothetical protein